MAKIINGVLTNTPEDNIKVEQFLEKQERIGLKDPETGKIYAIVPFFKTVSDVKWQFECLVDRIEYPEKYEKIENVQEAIKELKEWLIKHTNLSDIFKKEFETNE